MSSEPERRFHTDSRTSENFTVNGLESLTDQSSRKWGRYIVKELLDNALEAGSEQTAVTVEIEETVDNSTLEESRYAETITIRDDGDGMSEERLRDVFADPTQFGGTKRHYALPTRGNQGNALMTVLGIQYQCNHPLTIRNRGTEYEITAEQQPPSDEFEIEIEKTQDVASSGFEIRVNLGDKGSEYTKMSRINNTIHLFAALNPQASFEHVLTKDDGTCQAAEYPRASPPSVESLNTGAATTGKVTWFSLDEFRSRIRADARAEPDLPIRDFVSEFLKVTSSRKISAILDGFSLSDGTVRDLFDTEPDLVRELYSRMTAETTAFSDSNLDSTLGSIGDDLRERTITFASYFEQYKGSQLPDDLDLNELSVYYNDWDVVEAETESGKTIPFTFELAAVPHRVHTDPESKQPRSSAEFGINQSVAYSSPRFDDLHIKDSNGNFNRPRTINAAFDTFDHGFYVVTNLTCPNIDFQDKGKQRFDTTPFEDAVENVVGKAIRKIENDVRPTLNRLKEDKDDPGLGNKAPSGFIKETVRENFWPVHDAATDGGEYSLMMRQFFYPMRDLVRTEAEREGYEYASNSSKENPIEFDLRDGTFNKQVKEYEEEVLGERIIRRKARGFFAEPHSNTQLPLGTKSVEAFSPDLDQYGALLFIEKTGFFELLHEEFELSKRYDIGLVNSQGMSTIACQNLIEKIQSESDDEITLYTLSDLDIYGQGIASNAEEPDELSTIQEFDAELLGISLDTVHEYDLPVESVNYKESALTQLDNQHDEGVVSDELCHFLKKDGGQRVEINALEPAQLRDYLETRFEEVGIEKVEPDEDAVETPEDSDETEATDDGIDAGFIDYFREAHPDLIDTLREHEDIPTAEDLRERIDDSEIPLDDDASEKIHAEIIDELADKPPRGWTDIQEELIDDYEEELDEIVEEHTDDVADAAKSVLENEVTIEIAHD